MSAWNWWTGGTVPHQEYWVDPTGRSTYGIGLCGRCSGKFSLDQLFDDPNYPGLKVCAGDMDQFDPYRLPPREPDIITLEFYRPDTDISSPPFTVQNPEYPNTPGWPPGTSITVDGINSFEGT